MYFKRQSRVTEPNPNWSAVGPREYTETTGCGAGRDYSCGVQHHKLGRNPVSTVPHMWFIVNFNRWLQFNVASLLLVLQSDVDTAQCVDRPLRIAACREHRLEKSHNKFGKLSSNDAAPHLSHQIQLQRTHARLHIQRGPKKISAYQMVAINNMKTGQWS